MHTSAHASAGLHLSSEQEDLVPDIYQLLEDELTHTRWGQVQPEQSSGQPHGRRRGGISSSSSAMRGADSGTQGPGFHGQDGREMVAGAGGGTRVRRVRRAAVLSADIDEELGELLVGSPVVRAAAVAPATAAAAAAAGDDITDDDRIDWGFMEEQVAAADLAAAATAVAEDAAVSSAGDSDGVDEFSRVFGQVHGDGDDSPVAAQAVARAAAAAGVVTLEDAIREAFRRGVMRGELPEGFDVEEMVLAAGHISDGGRQEQQHRQPEQDTSRQGNVDFDHGSGSPSGPSSSQDALQVLSLPPSPEPLHLRLRRAGVAPQHNAAAAAGASLAPQSVVGGGAPVQPRVDVSSQDARILNALGGRSNTQRGEAGGAVARLPAAGVQQQQEGGVAGQVRQTAGSQRDIAILRALDGEVRATGAVASVQPAAAAERLATAAGARAKPRPSGLSAMEAAAATHQGGRLGGTNRRLGSRHHRMAVLAGEGGVQVENSAQQGRAVQQGLSSIGQVAMDSGGEQASASDEDFERPTGRTRGVRAGINARIGSDQAGAAGGQRSQRVVAGMRTRITSRPQQ